MGFDWLSLLPDLLFGPNASLKEVPFEPHKTKYPRLIIGLIVLPILIIFITAIFGILYILNTQS